MRLGIHVALAALLGSCARAAAVSPLTIQQVVDLAIAANPQLRSAEARWNSAEHSILPAYAPADPIFTFSNQDSPTNGFSRPSSQSYEVTQTLQFPGKGYLQGRSAERSAKIAQLAYEATRRDVRAEAETAFYQLLLDQALDGVVAENVETLKRVLEVTQVGYSTGRVTQLDFISAEFELASTEQQKRQLDVARAIDRANVNRLLDRRPDEPLELAGSLDFVPLAARLDALIDAASRVRQEILEAALHAENAEAALALAQLEYAPDFTLGYTFNDYQFPSAAPDNRNLQTHGVSVGINLPVFFWMKQREDVEHARFDLAAARFDVGTIRNETATQVSTLYWQAELAYRAALLYRDSLVPLARQGLEVALVAYQGGKVDFVALASALRQRNDARVAYLQAANQFWAQKIALEQAIGQPVLE
jgi:cobalt-zinc-cadmium efflux system outer membrane protein